MARRSRRDNSHEMAQAIVALIFLVALGMTGGNLQRAMELFLPLVIIGMVLAATGAVLYFLFRKVGRASLNPGFSRNLTYEASVASLSDSTPVPAGPVIPERFTQELLNQLEWRRFEILVQALFQAEGLTASRIRAGADGGIDLALRESPEVPS